MNDPHCSIHARGAKEWAESLAPDSVHCAVTSPPYWAQREYAAGGDELGAEPTPAAYIRKLAATLEPLRRALRDDGTLWLNIGDVQRDGTALMLPERVALALEDKGWAIRSVHIWAKPNPITTAATLGPIRAHETVFRLSPSYFTKPHWDPTPEKLRTGMFTRTVWRLSVGRNTTAHLASFPLDLPRLCIQASTSVRVCSACGAPRVRIVERQREATRPGHATKYSAGMVANRDSKRNTTKIRSVGFRPSCACDADDAPAVVADPFLGSGTTAIAARALGCAFTGAELNPAYANLARRRVEAETPEVRERWRKAGDRDLVDRVDDFGSRPRVCSADTKGRGGGPRDAIDTTPTEVAA